ncbi:ROK family protein [Natronospora cellulosivora (SeqCode)]
MIKNTKDLTKQNKYLILNEVIERQPVSRKELSQILDLSHTTVSNIIKDLIVEGLVCEAEYRESTGGRPPRLLEFRGSNKYLISVEMSYTYLSYAIYDLDFNIKKKESWEIKGLTVQEIIKKLYTATFSDYFEEEDIDTSDIIGIGISVPGIYDQKEDVLKESISEIWQDIKLKDEFNKYFQLPLYIENDANLSTYYESVYGVGVDALNLIYIFIAEGIGSGLVINGKLYKGSHGLAGEISHINVSEGDYNCCCGAKGCLEVMASMSAIKRDVVNALKEGAESSLQNVPFEQLMIKDIVKAYKENDKLAVKVIRKSIEYLLKTLSNLHNFLDPDLIIIGDIYNLYDKELIIDINEQLSTLSSQNNSARVVQRTEEEDIQLKSTAKYVFDKWKYTV